MPVDGVVNKFYKILTDDVANNYEYEFIEVTMLDKTRAALHRDVRAICTETCHFLGLEVTKSAMEIVAELVYKKLSVYATDLEAFAKHAKRTTINSDDVKLLARRNPSLKARLAAIAPANQAGTKDKRRKTTAPYTKQPDPVLGTKETSPITTKKSCVLENKEASKEEQPIDEDMDVHIHDVTIDLTVE